MRVTRLLMIAATTLAVASVGVAPSTAQAPLGITSARGLTVTPVYEGWYENPDGTFTLSFGYMNRNWEEAVDIPLGKDNFIEPARFDGLQPTLFNPRRHWGVFGVQVPADFGRGKVVWTLTIRGGRYGIPGTLKTDWKIDALEGEATTGNKPPMLRFSESGPEGAAPGGLMGPGLDGRVGEGVALKVWATDDGLRSGSVGRAGRADVPVTLTWFKHSGPGGVAFTEATAEVPAAGGAMTTEAMFDEPGEYFFEGAGQRRVRCAGSRPLPMLLDEWVCEGDGQPLRRGATHDQENGGKRDLGRSTRTGSRIDTGSDSRIGPGASE